MKSNIEVFFFSNGNTVVFKDGKQAIELQQSWLLLFAEYLESKGVDPTKVSFVLPSGIKAKIFKTPKNEYNWRINETS